MTERQRQQPKVFKVGEYVDVSAAFNMQHINGSAHLADRLGKPPYVFLERSGYDTHVGELAYIRSSDQRQHPLRYHKNSDGTPNGAIPLYTEGVFEIPVRFLEKASPPHPEFTPGRLVKINYKAFAQSKFFSEFLFEQVRGKFRDDVCKIARIIEATDKENPSTVHYLALLAHEKSGEKESLLAVPVEALDSIH